MAHDRVRVIAVDFDGCLCQDAWPEIGAENSQTVEALLAEAASGSKIVLWTCREGAMLESALRWCKERGLTFDAVNENLPERIAEYGNDCRKIGATEYWDDRAVRMPSQCHFTDSDGNEITECTICGFQLSPCSLREVETIVGKIYTIQILECKNCGTPSFGWIRSERG